MVSDLFTFALQNGLSEQTLRWILLLPLVATWVIFFRVVVGLEHLALNRGLLLALGVSLLGLGWGIFFFFFAVALDLFLHGILDNRRLLPPATYALILFFTLLALLLLLMGAGYFTKTDLIGLGILPILLVIVSAQGMLQINPGDPPRRPAFWLTGMLLFLGGGFFLLTSPEIQDFAFSSPIIYVVIIFLLMITLGRFRGLRLNEHARFFKIISRNQP